MRARAPAKASDPRTHTRRPPSPSPGPWPPARRRAGHIRIRRNLRHRACGRALPRRARIGIDRAPRARASSGVPPSFAASSLSLNPRRSTSSRAAECASSTQPASRVITPTRAAALAPRLRSGRSRRMSSARGPMRAGIFSSTFAKITAAPARIDEQDRAAFHSTTARPQAIRCSASRCSARLRAPLSLARALTARRVPPRVCRGRDRRGPRAL